MLQSQAQIAKIERMARMGGGPHAGNDEVSLSSALQNVAVGSIHHLLVSMQSRYVNDTSFDTRGQRSSTLMTCGRGANASSHTNHIRCLELLRGFTSTYVLACILR